MAIPTYLGGAAVSHDVHLGDKLWEVERRWRDGEQSARGLRGRPAGTAPASPTSPRAAQGVRNGSSCDARGCRGYSRSLYLTPTTSSGCSAELSRVSGLCRAVLQKLWACRLGSSSYG